jgi:hypothetical protein
VSPRETAFLSGKTPLHLLIAVGRTALRVSVNSNLRILEVPFMTLICDYMSGGSDLGPRWFYSTTWDLTTEDWSTPVPINRTTILPSGSNFLYHPTLVSPTEFDQMTTQRTGYVYYSFGSPTDLDRHLHYMTFCITNTEHPSC